MEHVHIVTARALTQALEEIRKAQEQCREFLSKLAETQMRSENDGQQAGLASEVSYDRLLRFVGFVLYKVSRQFCPDEQSPEFYFWPGYNSILGQPTKRIQIRHDKFPMAAGGIGFEPAAASFTQEAYARRLMLPSYAAGDGDYDLSDASIWFDCVLGHNHERQGEDGSHLIPDGDDSQFILGGTHQWVTNGDVTLSDVSLLDVLSINIGETSFDAKGAPPQEVRGEDFKDGHIHIRLNPRKFNDWGRQIAVVLNSKGINAKYKWPTPSELARSEEFYLRRDMRIITYRLYGLWLKSLFDPNWRSDDINLMIDDVRRLSERKHLAKLAQRIESLACARLNRPAPAGAGLHDDSYSQEMLEAFAQLAGHEYRCWYTLVLKKTALIPDLEKAPTELGSAMILSSCNLPSIFFHIIKPWIESIFLEIRTVESSILLRHKAGLDGQLYGQLQQARQFAHQTSGLITVPWNDPNREKLSEWAQFSLWMSKTLITQIWGMVTIDYRQAISGEADFYEWADLDKHVILERIVKLSLEHAIQRSVKAADSTDNDEINRFNRRFKRQAVQLLYKDDRIALLRERLGMVVPQTPLNEWMTYKSFVLFFYHCLWQATHHALKAWLADEGQQASYLWIEWDALSVSIYNRAPSTIPAGVSPKDKDFFSRLSHRYKNAFTVSGPEPVERERADQPAVWRTTINFKGGA